MAKSVAAEDVKKIVIACEAGIGSSLMVTNKLKKQLKKAGITHVTVGHTPARAIPKDAQIVVVHKGLSKMARNKAPWAVILPFDSFMNIPAFDKIVKALNSGADIEEE